MTRYKTRMATPIVVKLFAKVGFFMTLCFGLLGLCGGWDAAFGLASITVASTIAGCLPFALAAAVWDGTTMVSRAIERRSTIRSREVEAKAGTLSLPSEANEGALSVSPRAGGLAVVADASSRVEHRRSDL